MNAKRIMLDLQQTLGSSQGIVAEVKDDFKFDGGKPTEERIGTKYTICCFANGFEKITVRVSDKSPIPITQEELDSRNCSGHFVYATFQGFAAKLYQDFTSKEMKISATAEKIILIEEDE